MNELPIFRLRPPALDPERLAERLFGFRETQVTADAQRPTFRAGSRRLEIFREGGLWMEDEARLWSVDHPPADLPSHGAALPRVNELLRDNDLLPREDGEPRFQQISPIEGPAGSVAILHALKQRERRVIPLDVHLGYSYAITFPFEGANQGSTLPGVGGGAKLSVKLGDGGQIIGMSGALRAIEAVEGMAPVLPEEELNRLFMEQMRAFDRVRFRSFLAYHWAAPGTPQELLFPVRVYRATAHFGKREVPLRMAILPATERDHPDNPASWRGESTPTEAPGARGSLEIPLIPGAILPPPPPPGKGPLLASTYWLGTLGGLAKTRENARGFREGLPSGWSADDLGENNALKALWKESDDAGAGVDRRDFVFYTGHADDGGWMLATSVSGTVRTTMLTASDSSEVGDRWGRLNLVSGQGGRLRWLVVAACGPLQDPSLAGGGYTGRSAATRWLKSFDGLRLMMGYGTTTYDTPDEGWRLMSYATSATAPSTLQRAWLRAGGESQGPSNNPLRPTDARVYVATLSARRVSADGSLLDDGINDRMPTSGVAAPPIAPGDGLSLVYVAAPV